MKYHILCEVDASDIMDSLPDSKEVDFVYECYEYLSVYKQGDFIERLDVENVVKLFDDEKLAEHLGDEALIEELKGRGYKITKEIAK
jgi:hypothetical protein